MREGGEESNGEGDEPGDKDKGRPPSPPSPSLCWVVEEGRREQEGGWSGGRNFGLCLSLCI